MDTLIRALIVDDSAFVRKVVREILARSPFIDVVGMARDGEEALEMVEQLKPDVITCDLQMPRMNGVEFVRLQMERNPVPILVLTATPHDGELALQALEAGAVDLVKKPNALATDELLVIRDELVEKVKAASRAPAGKLKMVAQRGVPPVIPKQAGNVDVVLIGISTGGPQALRYLLPLFPADFPVPVAVVLHMPVGYTALFAEKLNEICKMDVKEAQEGDFLQPGQILIAQAGRHLVLRRSAAGNVLAQLAFQPLDKPHRPSVDVLFQSAAETYRSRVLAVVMTGMGEDGKQGAAWVKAQGGKVLTEAEESCVIYGMPRAVAESGLSDATFTLGKMAEGIAKYL